MADLPKDLLGTIVEYNRFEIRAIACVIIRSLPFASFHNLLGLSIFTPSILGGFMWQNITAKSQPILGSNKSEHMTFGTTFARMF